MTILAKFRTGTKKREKRVPSVKVNKWLTKNDVLKLIQKHKLRFDIQYDEGLYDITPHEADIYDEAVDDILKIIRNVKK
jgi:hypothetical protein